VAAPEPAIAPPAEVAAATAPMPAPTVARLAPIPVLEPAEGALTVGEDGRILWRDEELLAALAHEDPADPVLAPTIVLTSSASDAAPAPPPMPEIVTRVSTSGGRVWAVELGTYA
ncbi:MAG: D-alanyl-D-alanine carboxypeptidase, partial [Pararhodobacter sp.]|nr:D-alanyl-D-alanine carboxypeptidase [Pararhodobacter sp.]